MVMPAASTPCCNGRVGATNASAVSTVATSIDSRMAMLREEKLRRME